MHHDLRGLRGLGLEEVAEVLLWELAGELHRGVLRQLRDLVVVLEVPQDLDHFLLAPQRLFPGFVGEPGFPELPLSRLGPVGALASALGGREVYDAFGEHDLLAGVCPRELEGL